MKAIFTILICLGSAAFSVINAQETFSIKGKVIDSVSRKPIEGVSVSLLSAKDSFLVSFVRSDPDGNFTIGPVIKSNYLLLVSYPDYAVSTRLPDSIVNEIALIKRSQLLQEVVVKAKLSSIKVKGDTLEYNAENYKLHPNATVEELLQRLPGISVDASGQIRAQGVIVKKVLIDGEEFFEDDPTLVTRNLNADIVSKVQVFDKKTDRAVFTGIDDGKKEKTVNLQLKKDKKNGYFGKLELGAGTRQFYQNQGMFNYFKNDQKLSAYFTLSNTKLLGLGQQDLQRLNAEENSYVFNDLDRWNGDYNGVGLPKAVSGGVHYDNKWNENKETININYTIGSLNVVDTQETLRQNFLPSSSIITNSELNAVNHLFKQGINATYSVQTDSFSTLKLAVRGSIVNKSTRENGFSFTENGTGKGLNSASNFIATNSHETYFKGEALWQHRFRKPRRTIAFELKTSIDDKEGTGHLKNDVRLLNEDSTVNQLTDQNKNSLYDSKNFQAAAYYTEPLLENTSLILNYGLTSRKENSQLLSYNLKPNGTNSELDSSFSNNYTFDQFIHQVGAAVNLSTKRNRLQVGNDVSFWNFDQKNNFASEKLGRSFVNIFPKLEYQYNFSSLKNIQFRYSGNRVAPTIQQLQPVLNNNDPLNIYSGNVNLDPSFKHVASATYFHLKPAKDRMLNLTASYSTTANPIVLVVMTDSTGINRYSYANLESGNNIGYSFNGFYEKALKSLHLGFGTILGVNGGNYAVISNNTVNRIISRNFSWSFVLSKFKENKYRVQLNLTPAYHTNKSSLQGNGTNNYWGFVGSPDINLYFIAKTVIHTNLTYTWQQASELFKEAFNQTIWNADITRRFFKGENLSLKVSMNDILNKNIGFTRDVSNNFIFQNRYNTIARYVLLSVIWNFNKTIENKTSL